MEDTLRIDKKIISNKGVFIEMFSFYNFFESDVSEDLPPFLRVQKDQ